MGMAASQARYLGLTARKTNVEYEGQQINQARTALANQSANLWNEMLNMAVPTAPKTTDYTEQQYAFSDGANEYEIDKLQRADKTIAGEKYNYQVTYHYNQNVYKAIQEKNTNPQVQKVSTFDTNAKTEGNISVKKQSNGYDVTDSSGTTALFKTCTSKDLEELQALAQKGLITIDNVNEFSKCEAETESGETVNIYCKNEDLEKLAKSGEAGELKYATAVKNGSKYKVGNTTAEKYDSSDSIQKQALEQIRYDYPELALVADDDIYVYEKNGKMYFSTKTDLDKCVTSGSSSTKSSNYQISSPIDFQQSLNQYYAADIEEKVTTTEYARLDDKSGTDRYQNIKLESMGTSFALNSQEKTDEKAYEDAMQEYNYNITKYEKRLAEINAKTSLIQVEDRTLELRLRQLDTEQKALSTEMEAVKSLIQKNIETTFKTFSS